MHPHSTRRLWALLAIVLIVSFSALGLVGKEIHNQAPPMPQAVVTTGGEVLFTRRDIETGRQVYQSIGGQQVGSIWGHGSYLAPDWSADWLHREAVALLEIWARQEAGIGFAALDPGRQAALKDRLKSTMRLNTYNPETGEIITDPDRAEAIRQVATHYADLFGDATALEGLREDYAIRNGAVPDPARRSAMAAFFFWTAWAATPSGRGARSPTPTTDRTSRWSATRRRRAMWSGQSPASSC